MSVGSDDKSQFVAVSDFGNSGKDRLDGIVEGTTAGDLIDVTYTGDPEGDRVDHSDAIQPGFDANSDIIDAGAGDDTIYAGVADDPANDENGTVTFYDAAGNATGTTSFVNIERCVCFTPGTLIATPKGERKVEDLQVGDRVITRDNGIQEIRWLGKKALTGANVQAARHLRPVLIQQGALSNGLPERDMLISPNHRVLVANDKTALYFEDREVLVAAKYLTCLDGVDIVDVSDVTYIHFMFDQHEVVLSDGAWTESFQPGDHSLAGIGNSQRNELFELFPELENADGLKAYPSARRSLKKHEAQLLSR
ncbi:MAG: hypothetical protein ACI8Q6_003141 [Granulosicoccus sp.]|jgi:hypothetical protein